MSKNIESYNAWQLSQDLLAGFKHNTIDSWFPKIAVIEADDLAENIYLHCHGQFSQIEETWASFLNPKSVIKDDKIVEEDQEVHKYIRGLYRFFPRTEEGVLRPGDELEVRKAEEIWQYFGELKDTTQESKEFLAATLSHLVLYNVFERDARSRSDKGFGDFATFDFNCTFITSHARREASKRMDKSVFEYLSQVGWNFKYQKALNIFRKSLQKGDLDPSEAWKLYQTYRTNNLIEKLPLRSKQMMTPK